jgi:hypothetical protein
MNKYKYTLQNDESIFIPHLIGVSFECAWGKIEPNGYITIYKGYSWNGCNFVPDTKRTYIASLVHDFLYQFHPVNRKTSDSIFYWLLKKDNFMFSGLYYCGVNIFGGYFYAK